MASPNHYQVLGLDPGATIEEIRSRYRELARELHPDVNPSKESTARFLRVTESYQVLSDPDRRRNYDAMLEAQKQRAAARAASKSGARPPESRSSPSDRRPPTKTRPSPAGIPTELRLRLDAANALFSQGRLRDAEQSAKDLLVVNPKLAPAYALLGDIYCTQQKWEQSARMYALAIQHGAGDTAYERRYRMVIDKLEEARLARQGPLARSIRNRNVAIGVSLIIQPLLMAFVWLSNESPAEILPIILHWTPGLVLMLFLSGAVTGLLLSASDQLDRWELFAPLSGKFSQAGVLGILALFQFWVALAAYGVAALLQEAATPSLTRLFAWTVVLLAGFCLAFSIPQPHGWREVAIWGGNLLFLGGLCGWRVMDAFKG